MIRQWIKDKLRGTPTHRSSHWPKVRNAFLADHPACEACGRKKKLEVHHIVPFHVDPALELSESNLTTLCLRCHLLLGHLDDWKSWNSRVRADSSRLNLEIKVRA